MSNAVASQPVETESTAKSTNVSWSDVHNERLTALNNGFGTWAGFLHGAFTEVGQNCLRNAEKWSLERLLTEANLDFHVEKSPAYMQNAESGLYTPVPDQFITYRTDTGQPFAAVGAEYTPLDYVDALAPAAAFDEVNEGAFIGHYAPENGSRMAALYALPELDLGRDEGVLPVLLFWSSHDGTRAVEVTFVPVRLACFNGNMWHVPGTAAVYRLKHTGTVADRIKQAEVVMSKQSDFFAKWAKQSKQLLRAKLSEKAAQDFLDKLTHELDKNGEVIPFKLPKQQKADTIAEKVRDSILARYKNSENLANVRGTKYGMLQAVAEYVDYDHRTRVVDNGGDWEKQVADLRFLRSVSSHPLKEKATKLLVAA